MEKEIEKEYKIIERKASPLMTEGFLPVSIKDTGSGIQPEIKPKLFSKFVTNSSGGIGYG